MPYITPIATQNPDVKMLYIVTTKDSDKFGAEYTQVAKFSDDQWGEAQRKLASLRRAHGNMFKLLDH